MVRIPLSPLSPSFVKTMEGFLFYTAYPFLLKMRTNSSHFQVKILFRVSEHQRSFPVSVCFLNYF